MSDGNPYEDAAGVEQTDNQTDNPTMSDLEQDIDGSTKATNKDRTDPLASRSRLMAEMRDLDNVTGVAPLGTESVMVSVEQKELEATQLFTGVVENHGWYCASYRGHEEGSIVTFAPIPLDAHDNDVKREIVKGRLDTKPSLYQTGACGPGLTAVKHAEETGRPATFTDMMDAFGWYVAQINYSEHGETFVFMPFEGYNETDERVDASRVWENPIVHEETFTLGDNDE